MLGAVGGEWQVSSADPSRERRDGTSPAQDPRKPCADKDRARLTHPFSGRNDNDLHASESLCSNLDFKVDVQLSSWELPSLASWGVPSSSLSCVSWSLFFFFGTPCLLLSSFIHFGGTYHPTTF